MSHSLVLSPNPASLDYHNQLPTALPRAIRSLQKMIIFYSKLFGQNGSHRPRLEGGIESELNRIYATGGVELESFPARIPSPKSVRVFAFRTDLGEAGRGSQAIAGRVKPQLNRRRWQAFFLPRRPCALQGRRCRAFSSAAILSTFSAVDHSRPSATGRRVRIRVEPGGKCRNSAHCTDRPIYPRNPASACSDPPQQRIF
jgi:hypothetical protein